MASQLPFDWHGEERDAFSLGKIDCGLEMSYEIILANKICP
jgi:hypothetical protein